MSLDPVDVKIVFDFRPAAEAFQRLAHLMTEMMEAWQAIPEDVREQLLAEIDGAPYDLDPDDCWRCDAAAAENHLGTCDACLTDLRSDQ